MVHLKYKPGVQGGKRVYSSSVAQNNPPCPSQSYYRGGGLLWGETGRGGGNCLATNLKVTQVAFINHRTEFSLEI